MEIHLPDNALEDAVGKGLRATIMAGAVQHIIKELTPERLHQFATEILDKGLDNLNSWELQKAVSEAAAPAIKSYAMRPDFIARVEEAVKVGMEKFVNDLPNVIYEEFKSTIVEAITDKYRHHRR
jgi:hypothetical protein